eukprot:gene4984-6934_t
MPTTHVKPLTRIASRIQAMNVIKSICACKYVCTNMYAHKLALTEPTQQTTTNSFTKTQTSKNRHWNVKPVHSETIEDRSYISSTVLKPRLPSILSCFHHQQMFHRAYNLLKNMVASVHKFPRIDCKWLLRYVMSRKSETTPQNATTTQQVV